MNEIRLEQYELFLPLELCDFTVRLADGQFQKAGTLGEEVENYRVAEGAWLYGMDNFSYSVKNAIAKIAGLPIENQEDLHVVRYPVGGEYKPHHDYFHADEEYYDKCMRQGGQRVKSVIIYLNDNFKGGCTEFPEMKITVTPEKGKMIIWNNLDKRGKVNPDSIHAGLPVTEGTKYILVVWVRERRFINL